MRNSFFCLLLLAFGLLAGSSAYAQAPVANFSASQLTGCAPVVITFNDLSTGNITSRVWTLTPDNGPPVNYNAGSNTSFQYAFTGQTTVTVSLTVSGPGGTNTKTVTDYIVIGGMPAVDFTANNTTSQCAPKTVTFTSTVTANATGPVQYLWDFGDNTTSSAANPTHTYAAGVQGQMNVSLTVTNAAGCTNQETKFNLFTLTPPPAVNFTSTTNQQCNIPATVVFVNTPQPGITYTWNFGDGTPPVVNNGASVSHNYTLAGGAGAKTVTLTATDPTGCSNQITKPNFVYIGRLVAGFDLSNDSACVGAPVQITGNVSNQTGAQLNVRYYLGNSPTPFATGLNASYTFNTAGTYTIKQVVTAANCADSLIKTVTVPAAPSLTFTASPLYSCAAPVNVTFNYGATGAGAGATYSINYGDGTPVYNSTTAGTVSHSYTAFNTYNPTLTVTTSLGCSITQSLSAPVVVAPPAATISSTASAGCSPLNSCFTATPLNGTIVSYNWNFGDPASGSANTSTLANPCHNFSGATPQNFTVTLTFTLASGCTGTATTTVKIGSKPTASFTTSVQSFPGPVDSICRGTNVVFTNTSTGTQSPTITWYPQATVNGTNFGTGIVAGNFTYNNLGLFTPILVVSNNGCTDTSKHLNEIYVKGAVPNFTSSWNCANRLQITFSGTATGLGNQGGVWTWNFGDGNTATGQTVTHTYASYQTYPVVLTLLDIQDNCTSTRTINVTPFPLNAGFTVSNPAACVNAPVNVTTPTAPATLTYTYHWGDNTTSTVTGTSGNASHTYSVQGPYTIKLVVKDALNCTDSTTQTNVVSVNGPAVSFVANDSSICAGQSVTLTSTATSPGSTIVSTTYTFEDGTTATGPIAQHIFPEGLHDVTLTATDGNGCTASTTLTDFISALPYPVANFYTNDTGICPGATATFISTAPTGLSHLWVFEDVPNSVTSTAVNPSHTYNTPGDYDVKLIVTNPNGCSDTSLLQDYLTVFDIQAAFTMSASTSACPPLTVNFTNQSQYADYYQWNFQVGAASVQNPSFTFTTAGTFTVKLVATSNQGCKDSTTQQVTVGGPTGTLSYTPTTACGPAQVNFTVNNSNASVFTYTPEPFTSVTSTSSTYSFTYTQPGTYVPIIILSDGQSCQYAIVGADTIRIDRPKAGFTYSADSLCQYQSALYTDTSTGLLNPITSRIWYWDFPNATDTSHTLSPVHTYSTAGQHTVKLVVFTAAGCTDTVTRIFYTKPNPVINITPGAPEVCLNSSVALTVNGAEPAGTYLWTDTNPVSLSSTTAMTTNASPQVTSNYTVVATAQNGCKDTASTTVVVNPLPLITVTGDTTICEGESTLLTATGNPLLTTIVWSGPNLNSTSLPTVTATPPSTATYTLTGTTAKGCQSTVTKTVVVTPLPDFQVPNPGPICVGDTAQFQAAGDPGTVYTWTPVNDLSCSICPNPKAYPLNTTNYTIVGALNGCTDTARVALVVNPLPNVSAGPDQEVCVGDSVFLTASGAISYFWSPQPVSCANCQNTYVNPTVNTVYTVTGTDANGCVNKDSAQVTVIQHVPTAVSPDQISICLGDTAQLQASGGTAYHWMPEAYISDPFAADPMVYPNSSTIYSVAITENKCFTDTLSVTVIVNPLPSINLGPDFVLYAGETVTLNPNPQDATTFLWTPDYALSCTDCPFPRANPIVTTTYILTAGNEFGCKAKDTLTITVKCDSLIYFPNTFTPNGDGQNDLFYPRARGIVKIKNFRIYNRWGEVVFERQNVIANDINFAWDGVFKGVPLKADAYIYTAEFECLDGSLNFKKGDISLLR